MTAPTDTPTGRTALARAHAAWRALLLCGAAGLVLTACGTVEIDHSLVEAAGTSSTTAAPTTTSTTALRSFGTVLIPTPPTSAAPSVVPGAGAGAAEGVTPAATPTGGFDDTGDSSVEGATPRTDADTGGAPTTSTTAPGTIAITVRQSPFGMILVDGEEHVLYGTAADGPDAPTCVDACALQWVPIDGRAIAAGYGVDVSLVGTVTRADGIVQLTYRQRPVYRLQNEPLGTFMGQGDAGAWFVLDAAGALVTTPAT